MSQEVYMTEMSPAISVEELPDDVLYVFGTPQEAIPGHPVPYTATEEDGLYYLRDANGKHMLRIYVGCSFEKEILETRLARINEGHKKPAS